MVKFIPIQVNRLSSPRVLNQPKWDIQMAHIGKDNLENWKNISYKKMGVPKGKNSNPHAGALGPPNF